MQSEKPEFIVRTNDYIFLLKSDNMKNLQGIPVENPGNGIYIKVLNGKVSKVVI